MYPLPIHHNECTSLPPFYLPAPDVFMTDKWFHVRIEEWVVLDPVDTHRQTDTETETDIYIYRQIHIQTDTYTDRYIYRQIHIQTDTYTDRYIYRQIHIQTDTDRHIFTDRQIQIQTYIQTDTTTVITNSDRYRYRQVQYKQIQIKKDIGIDR